MEKKLQNPTSNKNETPAPQGGKWPDETIIRYYHPCFFAAYCIRMGAGKP